jgi:hypothetical protein
VVAGGTAVAGVGLLPGLALAPGAGRVHPSGTRPRAGIRPRGGGHRCAHHWCARCCGVLAPGSQSRPRRARGCAP